MLDTSDLDHSTAAMFPCIFATILAPAKAAHRIHMMMSVASMLTKVCNSISKALHLLLHLLKETFQTSSQFLSFLKQTNSNQKMHP